jgi:hypothetical protein
MSAYDGKIQSGGTQYVKAPLSSNKGKDATSKITGSDLRTRKSGK